MARKRHQSPSEAMRLHDSVQKTCPVGTKIQTLLFPIVDFSPTSAKHWAEAHGFSATKVHPTKNYIRIRQENPSHFRAGSFRIIRLNVSDSERLDVKAVIGCPK